MDIENLKSKIVEANAAYRNGNSLMTDSEFDDLVEQYQKLVDADTYNAFRDSLHESTGKVKHPFIMGSLDKLKAENVDDIRKFINSYIKSSMHVSAKVDGISCRLHYENGKLISASTRGDGFHGESLTDKIAYVKNVPNTIGFKDVLDIRGELVIFKDDFEKLSGFANARNACAGIMNKKYWNKEDITNVSFIAYSILGPRYTKNEQFFVLSALGFKHAECTLINNKTIIAGQISEFLSDIVKKNESLQYETDGLVICDVDWKNEDKYRPDACKAFKVNQLIATTKVVDIDWGEVSKDGFLIPVAVLEPVSLGGCIVSRATCHNLDYLEDMDIKYGSTVKLLKSGDIIPKIIEVVDNSNASDIDFPTDCPCCGSILERDGVNLRCKNKKCPDQVTHQIAYFIKKLGVKHTSEASLKNFRINSFDALLNFKPNPRHKTEMKLVEELKEKVFTKSKQELLAAMNFVGVGETLINKIVDFYGFNNIEIGNYNGLPEGVGDIILSKFKENILDNLNIVNMFINDKRYNFIDNTSITSGSSISNKNGLSICFTGKLDTMSRSEASKIAENAGFEVKMSVTNGLTYLVTNDADTNSSKGKNARKYGVKIINEKEFLDMCNNVSEDVMSL